MLDLGVLVTDFAFDPEHAEIVTGVEIEVVARLEADAPDSRSADIGPRRSVGREVDRCR